MGVDLEPDHADDWGLNLSPRVAVDRSIAPGDLRRLTAPTNLLPSRGRRAGPNRGELTREVLQDQRLEMGMVHVEQLETFELLLELPRARHVVGARLGIRHARGQYLGELRHALAH